MDPMSMGMSALGSVASAAAGGPSAASNEVGDTGSGNSFNFGGNGGTSAPGTGIMSSSHMGVPIWMWAGIIGVVAFAVIKR